MMLKSCFRIGFMRHQEVKKLVYIAKYIKLPESNKHIIIELQHSA